MPRGPEPALRDHRQQHRRCATPWAKDSVKPNGDRVRAESSYAFNGFLYSTEPGPRDPWRLGDVISDQSLWWGKTISDVRVPSEVPMFADGMWVDAFPHHTDTAPSNGSGGPNGILGQQRKNMWRVCFDRHAGKTINHVFVDGHVESIAVQDMWSLKWHREFDTSTTRTINW